MKYICMSDDTYHEDIAGAVGDINMGGFCLLLVTEHHAELGNLEKKT